MALPVPRRALIGAFAAGAFAAAITGLPQPAWAVDASNPGFEAGSAGWAALSGTSFVVTDTAPHGGVSAAALGRTSSSGAAALTDSPNQFNEVPAGTRCTASAWVLGPVGYKATVRWSALDGTNQVSATSKSVSFNGSWQQLPVATLIMPSGASTADLRFSAPSFPVDQTWYLDDVAAQCDAGSPPAPEPEPAPYAAHWTFDEPGEPSTAVDAGPHNNDGTNSNVVGDGAAYTFNGTNSRVRVLDDATLDPGTANFSFGATLQMDHPPVVGETYDVLRKGITTTTGGDYKLEIVHKNGQARARCLVKDAQKVVAASTAATNLADGRQHDVECSRVGNSVSTFIDGVKKSTRTVATLGSVANAANLGLGSKAEDTAKTGFDWYLGKIHDAWVRIG